MLPMNRLTEFPSILSQCWNPFDLVLFLKRSLDVYLLKKRKGLNVHALDDNTCGNVFGS